MTVQLSLYLFLFFGLITSSPISDHELNTNSLLKSQEILVAAAFLFLIIFIIIVCSCCPRHGSKIINLEKECSLSTHNSNQSQMSEFTIFPPVTGFYNQTNSLHDDEVTFEPLPEIRPRKSDPPTQNRPLRPAHFSNVLNRGLSLQDWFEEPHCNFPRSKLQYLQEVGTGWFGQVVRGEAQNIIADERKSQVIVKILREDATPSEHIYFLHEVCLFRDSCHPNILQLLGQCLECDPFLIILEYCTIDLKSYLLQQKNNPSLLKEGLILHVCCNIASALEYMHEKNFIHTDLAARNCLVTENPFKVKIGDYGTSIQAYKNDYYCLGDMALPIRWSAPESLHCTDTIIETKEVSKEANVWSFGVLMWEILEFGKLPYGDLTNEEVLQKVIVEKCIYLEQPKTPCIHKNLIFSIMQLCWYSQSERPSIKKILALLNHLFNNQDTPSDSSEFEKRWNALQPTPQEHNFQIKTSDLTSVPLYFENNFVERNIETNNNKSQSKFYSREASPSGGSVSAGIEVFTTNISPSLQNLTGSIEDLNKESSLDKNKQEENCLKSIDLKTDADTVVTAQQISEAIQDLDNILAAEAVSSSENSKRTTPEKVLEIQTLASNSNEPATLKVDIDLDSKCTLDKEDSLDNSLTLWKSLESSEQSEKVKDFLKLTIIDSEGSSDSDHQSLIENYKCLQTDRDEPSMNILQQENGSDDTTLENKNEERNQS
ncbi:serine/threonine-protein kinase LMTK3-like isoform X1 [Centruroides vittatus]|uniref:serine/threonine-protein kinase LMTK3-like isoform X1 n=2 Tax=Centruroides vittatus TaxID=120091 RepID=UPI003510755B